MSYQWWAFLNLLTCSAIAYICVGRLSMCHPGVAKLVRVKYTVLVTGSLAYGFQPILFNDWPSPGGVIFALSVLIGLLCSAARWRREPPKETVTRPAELV